jgi:hypothetical protein
LIGSNEENEKMNDYLKPSEPTSAVLNLPAKVKKPAKKKQVQTKKDIDMEIDELENGTPVKNSPDINKEVDELENTSPVKKFMMNHPRTTLKDLLSKFPDNDKESVKMLWRTHSYNSKRRA